MDGFLDQQQQLRGSTPVLRISRSNSSVPDHTYHPQHPLSHSSIDTIRRENNPSPYSSRPQSRTSTHITTVDHLDLDLDPILTTTTKTNEEVASTILIKRKSPSSKDLLHITTISDHSNSSSTDTNGNGGDRQEYLSVYNYEEPTRHHQNGGITSYTTTGGGCYSPRRSRMISRSPSRGVAASRSTPPSRSSSRSPPSTSRLLSFSRSRSRSPTRGVLIPQAISRSPSNVMHKVFTHSNTLLHSGDIAISSSSPRSQVSSDHHQQQQQSVDLKTWSYISDTLMLVSNRAMMYQTQLQVLSYRLQYDLPAFVERAMQLFDQNHAHIAVIDDDNNNNYCCGANAHAHLPPCDNSNSTHSYDDVPCQSQSQPQQEMTQKIVSNKNKKQGKDKATKTKKNTAAAAKAASLLVENPPSASSNSNDEWLQGFNHTSSRPGSALSLCCSILSSPSPSLAIGGTKATHSRPPRSSTSTPMSVLSADSELIFIHTQAASATATELSNAPRAYPSNAIADPSTTHRRVSNTTTDTIPDLTYPDEDERQERREGENSKQLIVSRSEYLIEQKKFVDQAVGVYIQQFMMDLNIVNSSYDACGNPHGNACSSNTYDNNNNNCPPNYCYNSSNNHGDETYRAYYANNMQQEVQPSMQHGQDPYNTQVIHTSPHALSPSHVSLSHASPHASLSSHGAAAVIYTRPSPQGQSSASIENNASGVYATTSFASNHLAQPSIECEQYSYSTHTKSPAQPSIECEQYSYSTHTNKAARRYYQNTSPSHSSSSISSDSCRGNHSGKDNNNNNESCGGTGIAFAYTTSSAHTHSNTSSPYHGGETTGITTDIAAWMFSTSTKSDEENERDDDDVHVHENNERMSMNSSQKSIRSRSASRSASRAGSRSASRCASRAGSPIKTFTTTTTAFTARVRVWSPSKAMLMGTYPMASSSPTASTSTSAATTTATAMTITDATAATTTTEADINATTNITAISSIGSVSQSAVMSTPMKSAKKNNYTSANARSTTDGGCSSTHVVTPSKRKAQKALNFESSSTTARLETSTHSHSKPQPRKTKGLPTIAA